MGNNISFDDPNLDKNTTMNKIDRRTLNVAIVDGVLTPSPSLLAELENRTLYFQPGKVITMTPEPQVNPNEILHNMLDHIHDGNREELVGQMILMLGWLHKGGTMPNISKDTVTSTTLWIIPTNE